MDASATAGPGPSSAANGSSSREKKLLTKETMMSMTPAKVFREAIRDPTRSSAPNGSSTQHPEQKQIVSLAFDDTGRFCTVAGEDDYFTTFDVVSGRKHKYFASQKYGVDHVTPTHAAGNILHASTKENHDVRYHSAHDNKYLKYFRGHTGRVRTISMHPKDNTFLTGSDDQTVLMWDLRANEATGKLQQMDGPCLTAWDGTGEVFAVALPQAHAILLYSSSSFDRRPFEAGKIDDVALEKISIPRRDPLISSITFSNDASYLLVGTAGHVHYLLDAFNLALVFRLEGHAPLSDGRSRGSSGYECCFTPDSNFVMSGSSDGRICIWDITPPQGQEKWEAPAQPQPGRAVIASPTLQPIQVLNENKGGGPTRVLRFSPKFSMFTSGGNDVVLWLPAREKAKDDDEDDMDIDM